MPRRRSRKSPVPQRFRLPQLPAFGGSGVLLATIALTVLSLWLLAGFIGQLLIGAQQDRRIAVARAELATVEAVTNQKATAVAFAESPAYAEQVAREQLGLAREGDTVLLPSFPQMTPTAEIPTVVPVATPTVEPNWRAWARAFFPPDATPVP